mgnify:CR=1 FL=1
MTSRVEIDAGICGFDATVISESQDEQHVTFKITSDCERIAQLAEKIYAEHPIDAYTEISPIATSKILLLSAQQLTGGCAGCVVPIGIFKAMQVAARLALPKDIQIKINIE